MKSSTTLGSTHFQILNKYYIQSWVLHGTFITQSNNKMQVLQSKGFGCNKQ